jgi:hypothetical protein
MLGELKPGQKVVMNIDFNLKLNVVGSAYYFSMPTFLMPDYKKNVIRN